MRLGSKYNSVVYNNNITLGPKPSSGALMIAKMSKRIGLKRLGVCE
jgi:hypothetical protein